MKHKRREEGLFFCVWLSNKAVKRTHSLSSSFSQTHTHTHTIIQTDRHPAGDTGKKGETWKRN